MSDNFFKNPKRQPDNREYTKYTPEYKRMGVNPTDRAASNTIPPFPKNEMFNSESSGELPSFSRAREFRQVEHVPVENDFSTFENEQSELDYNAPMIDNNENVQVNSTFAAPNLDDSKEDESILIVDNELLTISSFEVIKNEVENLVFGNHKTFKGEVSLDRIKVYKKATIKVGVFVE